MISYIGSERMINVLIDEFTPCLKDARHIMEVYDHVWTDEEI